MDIMVRLGSRFDDSEGSGHDAHRAEAYDFVAALLQASATTSEEGTSGGALPLAGADLDHVLALAALGLATGNDDSRALLADALYRVFAALPPRSRDKRAVLCVLNGEQGRKTTNNFPRWHGRRRSVCLARSLPLSLS